MNPDPSRPPVRRRRWPTWLLVFALGLLVGRWACAPSAPVGGSAAPASAATTVWTCAMHPQIRLPEPGACPICGMDLISANGTADGAAGALGPRALRLSAAAAALAEIETAPVERRAVAHKVHMVGKVAIDETRLSDITARVAGRLDRLFVDYTGVTVRPGDHMVELYSPQLIATQQELLQTIATAQRLAGDDPSLVAQRTQASVASARERLRLWGLQPAQIDAIVEHGEPLEHVTINAPMGGVVVQKHALEGAYVETGTRIYTIADLSKLWVMLDAYESDLAWLHYGETVEFTTQAYAGEVFSGRIAFIDPVLDDRTRTVKVRVNIDNADGRLKPDMFVRADVQARLTTHGRVIDPDLAGRWMCPMHPEVVSDGTGSCALCGMDLVPAEQLGFVAAAVDRAPLVVPATAPLITGKRAVVFVRRVDVEGIVYEARDVELGPRAGDAWVVHHGLSEGELVVVNGAFKLDSELQIRGAPSMMNPEGAAPPSVHEHRDR